MSETPAAFFDLSRLGVASIGWVGPRRGRHSKPIPGHSNWNKCPQKKENQASEPDSEADSMRCGRGKEPGSTPVVAVEASFFDSFLPSCFMPSIRLKAVCMIKAASASVGRSSVYSLIRSALEVAHPSGDVGRTQ